ncbi:hypothetical protein FOL47_008829 [Perkinsus chesapeaki]|uniref:Uncharacterized protein n=1 Tax=Perkinsus chesapeaki TaxID=330153 RepID=A0A7J6LBN7_PERCH|nr:hypothetical protein FOL47_008829 [Perkinsus chesapeaki]
MPPPPPSPPTSAEDSAVYGKTELGICPQDAIGRRKYQAVLLSKPKSKTRRRRQCDCSGFKKLPPALQAVILSVNAGALQCRPPVSLIPSSGCHCISGKKVASSRSSSSTHLATVQLKSSVSSPISPSSNGCILVHLAKMAIKGL